MVSQRRLQVASRYHSRMERAADLIERIALVRRAARRQVALRLGLSLAQLDALFYLGECNRFSDTPAAVADFLDATRGTVSQSLRALERKGLIERTPDAADRRVSHLRPSTRGQELIAQARDSVQGEVGPLGVDAIHVEAALTEALRAAQRARGGRTFGECGTCVHLGGEPSARVCGLTAEPLSEAETGLRCVEHEPLGGH